METKTIEACQDLRKGANWGKLMLVRFTDEEWQRRSCVEEGTPISLLWRNGWTREHLWALDLQTGEGALFRPGGSARADLDKHEIWVCLLFEPFLEWLYRQDLKDLDVLPDAVELPDAPFAVYGYRWGGRAMG